MMFPISMIREYFGYPINVLIHVPRKSGEDLFFDEAQRRIDPDNKKEFFYLKIAGKNAPAYAFENMVRTNRGLWAELYSPAPGEYYPCFLDNDVGKKEIMLLDETGEKIVKTIDVGGIRPMNVEQKNFYAEEIDRAHYRWHKKKGFLDKMLPFMLVAIFAFAMILMMWGYQEYGGEFVAQAAQRAAATWERVAETAGTVVDKAQSAPLTPPPLA